jgi:regulator of nonsense transcripts 3
VHVLSEDSIVSLSEKVRSTSFHDSRNTSNDAVLLGPPSVEFAPYARVPGNRSRKDGRQGTIDQDPEFVAFLESLTNPITKPVPVEGDTEKKEDEQVTITPLVQYIKDKKANKAKDASSGKSSKRAKEKEAKAEKAEAKKLLKRSDREAAAESTPASPEKKAPSITKIEKATKEAGKAANKQATTPKSKQPSAKESAQPPTAPAASSERRRERGDVSAAAKILQRDLGLASSGGRRRGKAATTSTESDRAKSEEVSAESIPSTPTLPTGPKGVKANTKTAKDNAPKGTTSKANPPATSTTSAESNTVSPPTDSATNLPGPSSRTPRAPKQPKAKQPAVSSTATQAFLKHANPSQGVTEELLEAAFSAFGKVTKVEVDRKKGFGYVDFAEANGLQKAIAASPVTVAQSQVVVLERKNPPTQAKTAKADETSSSQAPSTTVQQLASTQKRSRGPRTRGGRGHKKATAAGDGGKSEAAEATASSEAQS